VKLGSSLHKDLKSPSLTSLDDEDLSKNDDVSSSNTKDGRKLKDREVVKTSSSHTKDKNKPELNPACLPRCNCEELMRVEAKLETKDLWEKFHELGTEMIITKTGRRYVSLPFHFKHILNIT
jgi:T-box protein 20